MGGVAIFKAMFSDIAGLMDGITAAGSSMFMFHFIDSIELDNLTSPGFAAVAPVRLFLEAFF